MPKSSIRVLVVEDFEQWRRFHCSTLQSQIGFEIIGEVADGLGAVHQALQLQPDLILLDIGLPSLNGIEAARRIRKACPACRILFVSENRSPEIIEEALRTGAGGFVLKTDAGRELLPAVDAVLQGKRYLSLSMACHDSITGVDYDYADIKYCHEVAFYGDDASLVDGYARFIQSSLESGNGVIVVVNDSHRANLLPRLEADGVDVTEAIKQGHCILLDAVEMLSKLTVDDTPDPAICSKLVGDLIKMAARGVKRATGQVVVCGEIAPTLLSKGNADGAIKLEHLWDEITRGYGVHTLCGYLSSSFANYKANPVFQNICAEHSAVHGWGVAR